MISGQDNEHPALVVQSFFRARLSGRARTDARSLRVRSLQARRPAMGGLRRAPASCGSAGHAFNDAGRKGNPPQSCGRADHPADSAVHDRDFFPQERTCDSSVPASAFSLRAGSRLPPETRSLPGNQLLHCNVMFQIAALRQSGRNASPASRSFRSSARRSSSHLRHLHRDELQPPPLCASSPRPCAAFPSPLSAVESAPSFFPHASAGTGQASAEPRLSSGAAPVPSMAPQPFRRSSRPSSRTKHAAPPHAFPPAPHSRFRTKVPKRALSVGARAQVRPFARPRPPAAASTGQKSSSFHLEKNPGNTYLIIHLSPKNKKTYAIPRGQPVIMTH